MSNAAIAVILFVLVAPLSAFLVYRSIGLGHRLGIIDQASRSRGPERGVPRFGGPAIAIAFLVGIGLSFTLPVNRFASETERVGLLCIAAALVCFVLVVDDAVGMSPWTKLMIQIGAAAIVILPRLRGASHGLTIDQFNVPIAGQIEIPLWVAIPFTFLWFVGMMNAINWIDGVDGLAGSLALVAGSVLFLHTYFWPRNDPQFTISLLPLVVVAAVIGFLPFNWHPARIMLGDSGSNLIGFLLAAISIIGGAKLALALLVLGLPLLDTAWVIGRRWTTGASVTAGDTSHLHHRLLERGWSVSRIVLTIAGISLIFGVLALVLPNRTSKLLALLLLAGVLLLSVIQLGRGASDTDLDLLE